jgi:hypothetical protein
LVYVLCETYRKEFVSSSASTLESPPGDLMRYLNTDTLIFVVSLITIAAFFLGQAMDKVLGDEGFGPYGNMMVFWVGFVIGLMGASYLGFNMRNYQLAAAGGIVGAFATLTVVVLIRNIMRRAGY